ncbi:UNVERIFIED_CONTAM: hypothetical protein Sindi_1425100 [Sesamum indicum]
MVQLTRGELQRLMEEAGRNALVAYERRTATPIRKEMTKHQLFKEKEIQRASEGARRREPVKGCEPESLEIEQLDKQIDELKRRGELVAQNRNSPFCYKILIEMVNLNFRMLALPKYDGAKDPQGHVVAFELERHKNGSPTYPIAASVVRTAVTKVYFPFCEQKGPKAYVIYLVTIRQREDESLKSFVGRFNNETLDVEDLKIDMMVSILIHGGKEGPFALALARDPPAGVDQLMRMAQKYIDEEEMNAMKDGEWQNNCGRD